ncbi:Small-conductance mechanosensitive channel [Cnuella takakiae]|uniref:Small-conductance mechanosensitive channel n=1 Tax=Cnuella takakiae TaxID=1302690 RepID=A0A1M4Y6R8_9BACT|nr:mechanosensitive ion channel family protein [Cnuella takakiae]OLY93064.1 mechanosensitive ion channel protein MscS [Cnuella takakiae]SHF01369.1 Small-conductance mechanosensitive channel [Cnuella takakiae]
MKRQLTQLLEQWNLPPLAWNLILLLLALVTGLVVKGFLSLFIRKKTEGEGNYSLFRSISRHLGRILGIFLPLLVLNFLLPLMEMPPSILNRVAKLVEIGLIITFSALLIRSINVVQDFVMYRYDYTKTDNLKERKIRTQLLYLRQVITGFIVLLTIAAILLSFDTMRRLGAGLLTGVGIGGIVVGFAAQRSLANLLAGFQIAFTQPIRIDDVVVVEGEWGRVEEITLTYVVVSIWDERRLILPITYFIEKPFQNWTRTSSQIIGTVFLYADYNLPMDPLRAELDRLLDNHPLWDKRVKVLQVTNTTGQHIEIRILVSAANSGQAFDLRCFVREQMVAFINREFPGSLPRTRGELEMSHVNDDNQGNRKKDELS